MKHGRVVALLLVAVVLFAAFQLGLFSSEENRISFMIFPPPPTWTNPNLSSTTARTSTATLAPPPIDLSFVGRQSWFVYDKTHQTIQRLDSQTPMRLLFGLSGYANYANINAKDTGWIRVEQYYDAEQDIPEFSAPGYGTGYIVLTRYLDGQFLIDGAKYSDVELTSWQHSTSWTTYIGGWNHEADVVFVSHDTKGTRRTAVFWIVLDPSRRPSECTTSPSSCVDVSAKVAQGKDFTMEANIQEHWDDWIFYTDLAHTVAGPCDARFTVPKGPICIKHDAQATQSIKWGVVTLSTFCYFTTNAQGATTCVQTENIATIGTVRVYVTTTSNVVIVSQVYTNQTVVNTVTGEKPSLDIGAFCNEYPSFPLCQIFGSDWFGWLKGWTLGISNALIILVIVIGVIVWALSRRGSFSVNVKGQKEDPMG